MDFSDHRFGSLPALVQPPFAIHPPGRKKIESAFDVYRTRAIVSMAVIVTATIGLSVTFVRHSHATAVIYVASLDNPSGSISPSVLAGQLNRIVQRTTPKMAKTILTVAPFKNTDETLIGTAQKSDPASRPFGNGPAPAGKPYRITAQGGEARSAAMALNLAIRVYAAGAGNSPVNAKLSADLNANDRNLSLARAQEKEGRVLLAAQATMNKQQERVDRLNQKLKLAEQELSLLEPVRSDSPMEVSQVATGLATFIIARDRLVQQLTALASGHPSDDAAIKIVEDRLAATTNEIQQVELRQAYYDQNYAAARNRVEILALSLNDAKKTLQTRVHSDTVHIKRSYDLAALKRERDVLTAMRRKEVAYPGVAVRVVQYATEAPGRPGLALVILLIGAVTAMAVPIILVFLSDALAKGFKSADQIEAELDRPVSALVPELRSADFLSDFTASRDWPIDYLIAAPSMPFAEAFRDVRRSFGITTRRGKPLTLAVLSALPNEGKTTVSICLARSAALDGMRVALIDCDGRRAMLSKALPGCSRPGLVQVLQDGVSIDDALDVDLPSGARVLRHSSDERLQDLSMPGALANVLGSMADYDLVILDTPPVLALVEARSIASLCEKVVLVIRWRSTPRDAIRIAFRQLKGARVDVSQTILTRVRFS